MQPNDLSTQLQELKNYLREELRKKFGGLESTGRPAYAISLANRDMTTFHKNRIEKDGDPLSFRVGGVMELHQPVSNTDLARAAHVLTLMMHWAKDRDWTLRAIGSAWSFSDVAAPGTSLTTSKCLLVETKAFAFYHRTSEDGLVYVTSGATVRDLNERLDVLNRCLATSGSSDGQTIAGAISTGVHGASFNGGAIHDSVRAFHMAGPDGDLLVCRDDASVTAAVNEVKAAFAVSELVVDEELFDAIAVSFGSFGFMIGMVLETQPKYALRVIRRSLPSTKLPLLKQALLGQISFGDVDAQLAAGDGDEPPHHCGLLINPYDPDTYKIVLMYPRRPDPSQPIFEWPDEISSFGVAIVRLLGPLLELAD
ncbi:MAG: FAD-binding protein, partial [Myxococcota bacterium]